MAGPDALLSRMFAEGGIEEAGNVVQEPGFTQESLAIYAFMYLVFMSLCTGTCLPAGLFMPSIMLGATVGLMSGRVFKAMSPEWDIQPGLYALIGATAMLAGVFRCECDVLPAAGVPTPANYCSTALLHVCVQQFIQYVFYWTAQCSKCYYHCIAVAHLVCSLVLGSEGFFLNQTVFFCGYFDPVNIYFDNKNK